MATFRVSLGDNSIVGEIADFPVGLSILFWLVWLLCVIMSNIIFLNFIIAEASASYARVQENIEMIISKEKINLIVEAENMTRTKSKTKT